MPAKLTQHDEDTIRVSISGPKPEFNDLLSKVKTITGRRWNPEAKVWELPNEIDTLIHAVNMMRPELDALLQHRVRDAQHEVAEDLTTLLAEDAELLSPVGERLYPYQRAGVDYLAEHPHSILGDDMGLGKTVQALVACDEHFRRNGGDPGEGVLIICPNSLKGTWAREIEQWLQPEGDPSYQIIDGKNPAARRQQLEDHAPFVIVNWEKLRLMPELAQRKWYAVIADEAHRAKNRKAQQTQALWNLRAPIQLALSGTPIMNSPDELWPVLKWLYPKTYTSYWRFFYEYVDSYEVDYGGRRSKVVTGVRNPDKLRFELKDKLVRRTKRDVLDLPEKTRTVIPVELRPQQRKLYREAEKELFIEIERALGDDPSEELRAAVESGDAQTLQYLIEDGAARVTRLRQIASSPALLGGEDESAKYDAVQEIVGDAPHKQFVIFCWFKGAANQIAERLTKQGRKAEAMTGDTPDELRTDLVRRFQAGLVTDLICTISTGGVGLTLTAADTCIFVERDWTPAVNEQAEDRLHRIGQRSAVTVLVLEATDTVDTGKIAPKNRLKELIVGSIIGT